MGQAENKVQLEVLKYLLQQGHFCWRNNTTGLWDEKLRIYRSNPYALKGAADILCVLPPHGTLISIECKSSKGKASPDQVFTKKRMERAGSQYHVVKSLDEVKDLGL
jgi:hypothetical protein